MPVVNLELLPQEHAMEADVARACAHELSRITGIPKGPIVVLFCDVSPGHAATGGEMPVETSNREQARQ